MSSLEIGIVGLPNVGKSTLFNALLKIAQAQAANFPFTTIEPNVGVVAVPDERLEKLAAIVKPEKVTPATVQFVDIAGLVRGASQGEGLGNKFLAHIREVDAIAMVVRFFNDSKVTHVAGKIDPLDDIRTIQLELILADLATVERRLATVSGRATSGDKTSNGETALYQKLKTWLGQEELVSHHLPELTERETDLLKELSLLTAKPFLYVANISETELRHPPTVAGYDLVPISAKLEAELAALSETEQTEYLGELGLTEPSRNRLIRAAYQILGYQTYFTAGPQEVRAWTIRRGMTAPQAAGVIHGDFERGFIAAEVVTIDKFLEAGGWPEARSKGWIRTEGKTYVFQDGDVALFKFNV